MAPVLYEESVCLLSVRDSDVPALPERAIDAGVPLFHLPNPASRPESTDWRTFIEYVVAGITSVIRLTELAYRFMRLNDACLLMCLATMFAFPYSLHRSVVFPAEPRHWVFLRRGRGKVAPFASMPPSSYI